MVSSSILLVLMVVGFSLRQIFSFSLQFAHPNVKRDLAAACVVEQFVSASLHDYSLATSESSHVHQTICSRFKLTIDPIDMRSDRRSKRQWS